MMIIEPFKSVGNLFFSDKRQVIRLKLNEPFNSGIKGAEESKIKEYYDYFQKTEMFVYYNDNDCINAFEFFSPNPVFRELS